MNKNKKTILHIIDDLGGGGAEKTVVGVVNNLVDFNHIVVNLYSTNNFKTSLKCNKYYSLEVKHYTLIFFYIFKFKKIIKDNNVDIVHSTLFWSILLSRLACPKNIPLINSIQASISDSFEYKKWWIKFLDKVSYLYRKCTILGVSNFALQDYCNFLNIKPLKKYVLYNFVDIEKYTFKHYQKKSPPFKLITVGSLKNQKNQIYLIEAFKKLKEEDIELHIYGEGSLRGALEVLINSNKLKVKLMGNSNSLASLMNQYDVFVMPSKYEGFSLAVLEGMAAGVPMLLSNTPTFIEQCNGTAEYFDINNTESFYEKIYELKNNEEKLTSLSKNAYERVVNNFTLNHHLNNLKMIYNAHL